MAKAEITVHIADPPTVRALLAELMAIGRALKDEEPFPRTEIGDAIHNLRGRAETAERALASLRAESAELPLCNFPSCPEGDGGHRITTGRCVVVPGPSAAEEAS